MLASQIPIKFVLPFAANAGTGFITEPVPVTTSSPGRASLDQGFPPTTFDPVASGGNPPWGADMNGILNQATAWLQWVQAGGGTVKYDASFSASVGGYPAGASLLSATLGNGRYWISTVDNNTSNPDSGGANWIAFPDLNVQLQKPNYGSDTGAINAMVVTLFPVPTSWAQIVGAPIRVLIGNTNSVTNPTIKINGLAPATMVNSDNSAMVVGQLVKDCILEGTARPDGKFQVNSPSKPQSAVTVSPYGTGCLYLWPTETLPTSLLQCKGQLLNIADEPNLFNVIGTRYGGDGVTTFRLPPASGKFIRIWDDGAGVDPNAATRTNAGGGATGDHVGTNQGFAAGPINLSGNAVTIDNPTYNLSTNPAGYTPITEGPADSSGLGTPTHEIIGSDTLSTWKSIKGTMTLSGNSGATETRPVNIYFMLAIGR
jgi:hypothetical protein